MATLLQRIALPDFTEEEINAMIMFVEKYQQNHVKDIANNLDDVSSSEFSDFDIMKYITIGWYVSFTKFISECRP